MDEYSSTSQCIVTHEVATFLVSCEILSKAWEESLLANNKNSFTLNEYEGITYVAFPSFHKIKCFIAKESKYGEGNIQIDNEVLFDGLKGNDEKPALFHQGALELFLRIMKTTDFQAKMQIYTESKEREFKPIIFVGHSLGGSVATLATLWVLERRLRQSSPFCITFGCPLVGDRNLVEAVKRENWGGNFCHVVSKHDIVPRMFFAPFESIAQSLTAILPYWQGIVPFSFVQDACRTLLNNVLQYTYTVANYGVDPLRGSDGVIKRSPYRPFGTYMFCSSEGAACIGNSDMVLKMLLWTMQSHEKPSDVNIRDCFSEHKGYDSVLKKVIEKSISGRRILNPKTESDYHMRILQQLEATGFGTQNDHARIALQSAREIENKHNETVAKLAIRLIHQQHNMAEIEWYKERCKEDGIPYYDSFRENNSKKDFRANVSRKKLAGIWDDITEKWENHELPSDFQSQVEWVSRGNTYRRLIEPLDIAYFYQMSGGKGNYLSGRPNRHTILQKWFEEKSKTGSSGGRKPRTKFASLTQDSCFWAHVEEAWKDLENLNQGKHQKLENLEKFEDYVTRMIYDRSISSDVFLEGSSFMIWWEEWKQYNQRQFCEWRSPLYEMMANVVPKRGRGPSN